MPIYAYRCAACGHSKDVLRKLSDPPLADCPACGAPRFEKQLTAAGFQLKGSGWYVTDFRNPQSAPAAAKPEPDGVAADKADKLDKVEKPAEAKPASAPVAGTTPTAAPSTPAPATKPAPPASPGGAGDAS